MKRLPGWLQRLVEIGALPSDSDELRARKAVLVLSSTLMAALACVWVVTYAVLGLWVSAAIPFAYQVATAASIYTFARTRRYALFRQSQLGMSLLLPFALQWSLGGFENSSAVCLWAFTSPMGALLFVGARQAVPWFLAFVALVVFSAAIDPALAAGAPDIPQGVVVAFFALNILGVATTVFAVLQYFVRARERALTDLPNSTGLELEQAKSERLLLNVLPAPVAARLKEHEGVIADDFPAVTVLFADIVGFTPLSERLSARRWCRCWTGCSRAGTRSSPTHGVEKIKTIGDAYMVAGGIPLPREDHAEAIAELALAMGPQLARLLSRDGPAARGPDRHRHRPGRRRRDRPREVQLRPVGRHRQHRQPHGVPRAARHDPGDRAGLRAAATPLRAAPARDDRGQGQGPDDLLPARRTARLAPCHRPVGIGASRRRPPGSKMPNRQRCAARRIERPAWAWERAQILQR